MDNSRETASLFTSNEIMSTFLSAHTQSNPSVVKDLKEDPKAMLTSLTNCDLLSVAADIQVAENSKNTIFSIALL